MYGVISTRQENMFGILQRNNNVRDKPIYYGKYIPLLFKEKIGERF